MHAKLKARTGWHNSRGKLHQKHCLLANNSTVQTDAVRHNMPSAKY